MPKSALIFGASGVSGWAFVNEILHHYPRKDLWRKVYALTNRPLSLSSSLWPADERLDLVSGVDLLKGSQEDLETSLSKIAGIQEVTHIYYLAYKASPNPEQEYQDALTMFHRTTIAIDLLSPALEFLVLQTGAKTYGCHLLSNRPADSIPVPFAESHTRLPSPYSEQLFYHAQLDFLSSYAAKKSWNWCETRPDIIIGFVPNQNFYSLATSLGIFLSLWKEIEGEGLMCPYPGSEDAWRAMWNQGSSDMIARQTIHLSLTLPMSRKGEAFNVADSAKPESWETKWPEICDYFGLKGTPPNNEGETVEVGMYIAQHMDAWKQMEREYGLRTGVADSGLTCKRFEYFLLELLDFDRQYDMRKVYSAGFEEERTTREAWGGVFDRMKKAKIIPS